MKERTLAQNKNEFDGQEISQQIAMHVKEILRLLGEDPEREGLRETPQRVAKALLEITHGLRMERPVMKIFDIAEKDGKYSENQLIILRDISLRSLCEHHLLPIIGKVHVAYIVGSSGKVAGLSKIIRLVDYYASRPQLQERLTEEIAEAIMNSDVKPKGVFVAVYGIHMCTYLRGVKDETSRLLTMAYKGEFETNVELRNSVIKILNLNKKENLL